MESVPLLAWAMLAAFGISMVVLDLFVAGTPGKQMTFRNSLAWSIVWMLAGVSFSIPVWLWLGGERGSEYLAGYLIERSLSLDNVFVFALLFAASGHSFSDVIDRLIQLAIDRHREQSALRH
jgi:tellurite resistance protein TerC